MLGSGGASEEVEQIKNIILKGVYQVEKEKSLKDIYKMLQAEEIQRTYRQAATKAAELLELLDEESNQDANNKAAQNAARKIYAAVQLLQDTEKDINTIKNNLKK